jgi:septal ring factor EnvC (AmiA/AmiB activator)
MKYFIVLNIVLFVSIQILSGQTKAELEEQRKKALDEISYVDNLLKTTAKEKNESLNALRIIGNKLNLREYVIRGLGDEISLLNDRIELNQLAIDMMEKDLIILKNDYSRTIISSYKAKKINQEIIYILSAKDFNQGYKRLKYLQQVTKYRRNESEIIAELKSQIEETKKRLELDLQRIKDLKSGEEQQKNLLQGEKSRKQKIVNSLGTKEKQLQKELEDKKRIAKEIESEIVRLIAEERKKSLKTEMTPEQKLISDNFSENKGRLPWPVERGIVTGHFGVHQHPVLKYVTVNNKGIEITSSGKTKARSIFKGEIARVFAIPGANWTIIVKHGKYLSVYTNIINVKVQKGDKIETKQELGDVFVDPGADNNCILKFMIFEQDYLDPELWIAKI